YFGGGLAVSDDAVVDDGRLVLFSIKPQSLGALARLLPALIRGPDGSIQGGELMRDAEFRIDTGRSRRINTDGEELTHTPATFRVHPGALKVCVPTAYREAYDARPR